MNMAEINVSLSAPAPPKIIFIVPYRDRPQQQLFFRRHIKYIMEDYAAGEYEVYFSHQCDTRQFNRGAMKNIGFIAMRDKYPANYRDITFVFNDVDTLPFTKNYLDFKTTHGTVKHFYGFTYTLGGIVSITGGDFEKCTGFPCFFQWSMEDNLLQSRVLAAGIKIDRSNFNPLYSTEIMSFRDGITRSINHTEFDIYMAGTTEGIDTITGLEYEIVDDVINVKRFDIGRQENKATSEEYDLRKGNAPFGKINKNLNTTTMGLGVMAKSQRRGTKFGML
jgi:hypothetical protein